MNKLPGNNKKQENYDPDNIFEAILTKDKDDKAKIEKEAQMRKEIIEKINKKLEKNWMKIQKNKREILILEMNMGNVKRVKAGNEKAQILLDKRTKDITDKIDAYKKENEDSWDENEKLLEIRKLIEQ